MEFHHEPEVLKIGMEVPDFKLDVFDPKIAYFEEITLEQLKQDCKWIILFFYPADFTFVCPTELADLAENYEKIKELGGEVISVSTDTKFVHLAWHESERLLQNVRFPMGSDPTGIVSKLFGVYDHATGLALRGTFIVNPEGILVSSEIHLYNVGRNSDELVRKLQANTYLAAHPVEACPAKWQPGDKTLTPSKEMVGHVYEAIHE